MDKKQIDFIQDTNNAYFCFVNEIASYVNEMDDGKDKKFINIQMQSLALKIEAINNNINDIDLQ